MTDQDTYWQNTGLTPAAYDKEGNFLFSWWNWDEGANEGAGAEVNREGNTGTLQSSTFLLKAGAVVSFRFGGGGGNENIYLEFVKKDGTPLAKFYNTQAAGGKLIAYTYTFAELDAHTECYVRVTDNAASGWGCFTLDDVQVNLASAPKGFNLAVNQLATAE